ncbi:MAG: hypothetical protein Q9157_001337 [Trypethelium eluteriae]
MTANGTTSHAQHTQKNRTSRNSGISGGSTHTIPTAKPIFNGTGLHPNHTRPTAPARLNSTGTSSGHVNLTAPPRLNSTGNSLEHSMTKNDIRSIDSLLRMNSSSTNTSTSSGSSSSSISSSSSSSGVSSSSSSLGSSSHIPGLSLTLHKPIPTYDTPVTFSPTFNRLPPAPSPADYCHTSYKAAWDAFTISGSAWDSRRLGWRGSGLKRAVGECGAVTKWQFTSPGQDGWDFTATFRIGVGMKKCVASKLEKAGSPGDVCSGHT